MPERVSGLIAGGSSKSEGRPVDSNQIAEGRRRRVWFFLGLAILDVPIFTLAGIAVFRGITSGPLVVALGVLFIVGVLWLALGIPWMRSAQPATVVSESAAAEVVVLRNRIVRRIGIWRFGLIMGITMTASNVWTLLPDHSVAAIMTARGARILIESLAFSIPIGLLAGYVSGRVMWSVLGPRVTTSRTTPSDSPR
jgi:hypothetical protein